MILTGPDSPVERCIPRNQACPYAKLLYVGHVSLVPAIKVPVRLILTLIPPLLSLASVPLNKLLFKRWSGVSPFGPESLKQGGDEGVKGKECV